jgi:molybdopterin converting factor subunit 1
MIQSVALFARLRDLAGSDSVAIELPASATVADLRRQLAADFPSLGGLLQRSAVAVNAEYADDGQPIPQGAEIAIIPPVSGGER